MPLEGSSDLQNFKKYFLNELKMVRSTRDFEKMHDNIMNF